MHQIKNRSSRPVELQTLQGIYARPQSSDWAHMHRDHETAYLALRDVLADDQGYFCIYCEICLDPQGETHSDRGHIEHHKPKSQFPHLMFDWANLMYCCTTPDTCGMAKQSTYFTGFLNPYTESVEDWLHTNAITGELEVSHACPPARVQNARECLSTLNLNSPGLTRKRQSILRKLTREIDGLASDADALDFFKEFSINAEEPFITARQALLDRLIPKG